MYRHVGVLEFSTIHLPFTTGEQSSQHPDICKMTFLLLFSKKICLFYLFMAALGLHRCTWAFCSCGEWGLLSTCGAQASYWGGFSCCRAWALGPPASVVVALGL